MLTKKFFSSTVMIMKRALVWIIPVLLLSVFITNVKAQEPTSDTTVSASGTAEFINYDLAFPGILPDHPLYKLKVLRDKIAVMFILDPQEKIKFYLLQTDKGILAAAMLVEKGKIDLAAQTALKAEHNFTMISQVVGFQRRQISDALIEQLEIAALKHQEVLLFMAQRVPEDKKTTFLTVVDFSKRNMQSIKEQMLPVSTDMYQSPDQ